MTLSKNTTICIVVMAVVVIVVAALALTSGSGNSDDSNPSSDNDYYKGGITVNNRIESTTSDHIVTLHDTPKIFAVYAKNVELLCALGCEDLIVGAYISEGDDEPMNSEYRDAYKKVVNSVAIKVPSNAWSKEEVMKTGADLIVGWSSTFNDSHLGSSEYWSTYGIQCFRTNLYGNSSGASMETYYKLMDDLGTLLNAKEKADANVQMWKGKIADIQNKTSSLPENEKPKVLVIDYTDWSRGSTLVYGTDMLTGCLVEGAGADCIDSGRMTKHTLEEIAKMDYNFVLTVGKPSASDYATPDDWWNSTPVLAAKGIEAGHVKSLDFGSLYMSGILQENILDILFEMFYPNLA